MNRNILLIVFITALGIVFAGTFPTQVQARFRRPDLEKIPVADLIKNLEAKVKAEPNDGKLRMNLARVYAMAYASKSEQIQIEKRRPNQAWFGYTPPHIPFGMVKNVDDKKVNDGAKKFLKKAIASFRKAIEMDKENLTARLSLAWCLQQSGNEMEALEGYREVIARGWEKEKDMKVGGLLWQSVVAEAAQYLVPLLDKDKSNKEIEAIKSKVDFVRKIPRPITPIAIGLNEGMKLDDLIDRQKTVQFDVDGSGSERQWSWISSDAGWLVHDAKGNGKITSGLQLFGNVTFWCFWDNGYEALSSLDENSDNKLSGKELRRLAIWRDKNQNGVSDPGEVQPLSHYQITEISCQYVALVHGHEPADSLDAVAMSPSGVKFSDGSTRATYDVILHSR